MKVFLANNRTLVTVVAVLLIIILYTVFAPRAAYHPSSGVGILITDGDLLNTYDKQHLMGMLPAVWWRTSAVEWVLYEVNITPTPVEVEQCRYGDDKKIIRQRVDLAISILSVKTRVILGKQTFTGKDPQDCPNTISVSPLPSLSNPGVFSKFETSRDLYGDIGNAADIQQWVLAHLNGQPDLPALTAADTERSGIKIAMSSEDPDAKVSTLNDFIRLIPASWMTKGHNPRYEIQLTASVTIVETCPYSFDSNSGGIPFLSIDRLRVELTITMLDLLTFEPVDAPQTYQGTEPPQCPDRRTVKSAGDFNATLIGDSPSAAGFEDWLKTITPDLVGLESG